MRFGLKGLLLWFALSVSLFGLSFCPYSVEIQRNPPGPCWGVGFPFRFYGAGPEAPREEWVRYFTEEGCNVWQVLCIGGNLAVCMVLGALICLGVRSYLMRLGILSGYRHGRPDQPPVADAP